MEREGLIRRRAAALPYEQRRRPCACSAARRTGCAAKTLLLALLVGLVVMLSCCCGWRQSSAPPSACRVLSSVEQGSLVKSSASLWPLRSFGSSSSRTAASPLFSPPFGALLAAGEPITASRSFTPGREEEDLGQKGAAVETAGRDGCAVLRASGAAHHRPATGVASSSNRSTQEEALASLPDGERSRSSSTSTRPCCDQPAAMKKKEEGLWMSTEPVLRPAPPYRRWRYVVASRLLRRRPHDSTASSSWRNASSAAVTQQVRWSEETEDEQEEAIKEELELEELTTGVLFLVMLIFLGGTFFLTCEKKIPLPHTVVLFLYGLVVGGITLWISPSVGEALGNIPPDLLFFIFLPVLIFEGSYAMNSFAFRRVVWQTIILATLGIVVNTALLAVAVKVMFPDWTWYTACLLGSLLSATDPVAVVSLLKNLRVDKFLTAMVDGEAVMNDGTAIIIFTVLMPAEVAGHLTDSPAVLFGTSVRLLLIPVLLGPIFGFIQLFWLRHTHHPLAKACVTVSVSYVSYYIASKYVGTSAVLTLCFEGVFLSYYYPSLFPGKESNFVSATWEFLVHLSNTVLFSLVGVILVADVLSTIRPTDIFLVLILYIVMIIARFVMLELLLPIVNLFPRKINQRDVLLLTHAGLRGGVAVTLALAVKQRDIDQGIPILKLTSGVVLLTLLINATTAGFVVEQLGFKIKEEYRHIEMKYGMRFIKDTEMRALEAVKRDTKYKNTNWHMVEKYLTKHLKNPYRATAMAVEGEELSLNRLTMTAFKASLWRQRDELVISETVIQQLTMLANELIEKGELFDVRRLSLYHHRSEDPDPTNEEGRSHTNRGHHPPRGAAALEEELGRSRVQKSSEGGGQPSHPNQMDIEMEEFRRIAPQKSPPRPLGQTTTIVLAEPPADYSQPQHYSRLNSEMSVTSGVTHPHGSTTPAKSLIQSFSMLLPRLESVGPLVKPSEESRRKRQQQRRGSKGFREEDDDDEASEEEEEETRAALAGVAKEEEEDGLLGLNVDVEQGPSNTAAELEEEEHADATTLAIMQRLLPMWVVVLERMLGNGFFESAHRRAQENAFMTILAVVKCLTALSNIKYQHVTSPAQARRINRWLQEQLKDANACINFFYNHFPEATNFVSSTRAVLSVAHSIQEAIETLHLNHGFGTKITEMLEHLVTGIRDNLPHSWGRSHHQKEVDLVMRAVASTTLGKGLRRAEISAITSMGLVRKFKEGDVITLPTNAFLVVVFGSLRTLRHPWTTAHADHDLMESFGDTVGLDAFLLPASLRIVERRRWEVITEEATALLISFQSIQPFLTERSLRAVKALWRAAAVEAILPILQEMITVPMRDVENSREHLMGLVMAGTPLIGPEDCNRFEGNTPFHLCFYLRGQDSKGFFTRDLPPCHVSTFYLNQVEWTSADVVLYVVPVNISDGGYVPWGSGGGPADGADAPMRRVVPSHLKKHTAEANTTSSRHRTLQKQYHTTLEPIHVPKRPAGGSSTFGPVPSAVGLLPGRGVSTGWISPPSTPTPASRRASPERSHTSPPSEGAKTTLSRTAVPLRPQKGGETAGGPLPAATSGGGNEGGGDPTSGLAAGSGLRDSSTTTPPVFVPPSVSTEEGVRSSRGFTPSALPRETARSFSPPEKRKASPPPAEVDGTEEEEGTLLDGTETIASLKDPMNSLAHLRQPIPRFHSRPRHRGETATAAAEARAVAAVADAAAAASDSATFGTAMRALSQVLVGVVSMEDTEEAELAGVAESTELYAATLETSTTFGSPLGAPPRMSADFGSHQSTHHRAGALHQFDSEGDTQRCCVLQSFPHFVTPVPLVNQLFAAYASMVEQLCIAALRYVLLPSDLLNIQHAQRVGSRTVEFLLKFAMQIQLVQQALEGIYQRHHHPHAALRSDTGSPPHTTAASGARSIPVSAGSPTGTSLGGFLPEDLMREGRATDTSFHVKVCQWAIQAERCGRYHLRTMILSLRAYANRRFEAIATSLRQAVLLQPELSKVENVETLQVFLLHQSASQALPPHVGSSFPGFTRGSAGEGFSGGARNNSVLSFQPTPLHCPHTDAATPPPPYHLPTGLRGFSETSSQVAPSHEGEGGELRRAGQSPPRTSSVPDVVSPDRFVALRNESSAPVRVEAFEDVRAERSDTVSSLRSDRQGGAKTDGTAASNTNLDLEDEDDHPPQPQTARPSIS